MKKKHVVMILALPTLAVLAQISFTLVAGVSISLKNLGTFWDGVLFFLVGITIAGIPLYVWIPLGIAGYGVGTWLFLTSRLRGQIRLGMGLSMLPVLIIVLAFFFLGYRGP